MKLKLKKCKIKDGWVDEGKSGVVLGDSVWVEQFWTPVLWDGEEDPDFVKTAGIDIEEGEVEGQKRGRR